MRQVVPPSQAQVRPWVLPYPSSYVAKAVALASSSTGRRRRGAASSSEGDAEEEAPLQERSIPRRENAPTSCAAGERSMLDRSRSSSVEPSSQRHPSPSLTRALLLPRLLNRRLLPPPALLPWAQASTSAVAACQAGSRRGLAEQTRFERRDVAVGVASEAPIAGCWEFEGSEPRGSPDGADDLKSLQDSAEVDPLQARPTWTFAANGCPSARATLGRVPCSSRRR